MRNFLLSAAGVAAGLLVLSASGHAEHAVTIPAPATDVQSDKGDQVAVLAGGCFWGMEGLFEQVKGVKSVTSGYAGGTKGSASYEQVSSETTGHAESVRIVYNPAQVSYGTLLRIYFSVAHDPTTLNYQGPDHGTSYRSAIFPQNAEQKRVAAAYIAQLDKAHVYPRPIVTRLETGAFYPAEEYHQRFFQRNPTHPYIVRWDKPKVAAFKEAFPTLARAG